MRLKHEEKVSLIQDILKWVKGSDVLNVQRCFMMNFGYQGSFQFPNLRMTTDSDTHLKNIGTFGNQLERLEAAKAA